MLGSKAVCLSLMGLLFCDLANHAKGNHLDSTPFVAGSSHVHERIPVRRAVENSDLTGIDFTDADLSFIRFLNVDLTDATFVRTDLAGDARIIDSTLDGADFFMANLSTLGLHGLDLGRVKNLHTARFNYRSRYDQDTLFPEGFNPDEHGLLPDPYFLAGDADWDWDFDQHDVVKVLVAGTYPAVRPVRWGEGDWNAVKADVPGDEFAPFGDGFFDHQDLILALQIGHYGQGKYTRVPGMIKPDGILDDGHTSVICETATGELSLDVPKHILISKAWVIAPRDLLGQPTWSLDFEEVTDVTGGPKLATTVLPGLTESVLLEEFQVTVVLADQRAAPPLDLVYIPRPTKLANVPEPHCMTLMVFGFLHIMWTSILRVFLRASRI